MSYTTEHRRIKPVLDWAGKLDIGENPAPEALFEPGGAGFQIWCTPDDHPQGWDGLTMSMGSFTKPCAYVASAWWGWEGETITSVCLMTDAYELLKQTIPTGRLPRTHNRRSDIAWAKKKIRFLFRQAGVPCPPIMVAKPGA
jgi:hypothetical protein